MNAIILARVSTEEQKDAGNSLPAQTERLKAYCERKGFKIVEEYSFDESAYKDKRDEFDRIITYLKTNKEKVAICFDKVDRLSRNVFDKRVSMLYEKAVNDEIELHFVSDGQVINNSMSAVEKFQFGMSLGLAKYYSDAISDNVKRAYEEKLRRGEWIGKAPLGYLNITREDKTKDIIFDEERAHIVRKIFELYSTGNYSMKILAGKVNEMGLRGTQTGKPISASQIELILKNPFYHGIMQVKGQLYAHKYEPLITYNLFCKIKDVISGYNKANFKRTNKPYVFRGLIKCPNCGCVFTPEIKKGKYVYYHCTNYHGNCTNNKWMKEEDLISQLAPTLKGLKLTDKTQEKLVFELKKIHGAEMSFYEKETGSIKQKIEILERRIKTMYEDRLDGRITPEMYDKMFEERTSERNNLLTKLKDHSEADQDFHITLDKILSLASRAYEIFQSSEPEEKTQFLIFLLQNSSVEQENLLFELKSPYQGLVQYTKTKKWLRD